MPNTATMAIPTNRHATAPAAIMPTPTVEAPAWLITQRAILREAPDGDTAIRWQLAAALVYIASLEAQIQAAPRRQHAPTDRRLVVAWCVGAPLDRTYAAHWPSPIEHRMRHR